MEFLKRSPSANDRIDLAKPPGLAQSLELSWPVTQAMALVKWFRSTGQEWFWDILARGIVRVIRVPMRTSSSVAMLAAEFIFFLPMAMFRFSAAAWTIEFLSLWPLVLGETW